MTKKSSRRGARRRSRSNPGPFSALRGRLVVVSNRLPLRLVVEDGETVARPATGGLVTALDPVLRRLEGIWIGWDGGGDASLSQAAIHRSGRRIPYGFRPVSLDAELVDLYYLGFSNETIWPLFHDLVDRARFRAETWEAYQRANRLFADEIVEATGPEDAVWVQDYHLALVGREVRRRANRKLLWFLHIPFPPLDILARLPWRFEFMDALLDYDLLGFQTRRDVQNFLSCVRTILPSAAIRGAGGATIREIGHRDRTIRVGRFPISIDYGAFDSDARSPEVARAAERIHENLPPGSHVLGIDRLDYTKGIPERLAAFELLLERHPEMRGRVTLVQVAVPSRGEVEEYRQLRAEIERQVGRINGRFTSLGWAPILYIHRSLSREELLGYYRACEVALITPLKDGMNLVAKEYCASSVENSGVLILSEFAGAAAQLFGPAMIVNPHDTEQVAEALHRAVTMDPKERSARMRRLRRQVRQYDIGRWVQDFSAAAGLVAARTSARTTGARGG